MIVVRACWDAVFNNPNGPVSFSCQNPRFQNAWRLAFAVCRRTVVASRVTILARSEVVVWGRAKAGQQRRDYYRLVEALQEPEAVSDI